MEKNPQFHGRAKHIDIKHHYIRDQVTEGAIALKYYRHDSRHPYKRTYSRKFLMWNSEAMIIK